MAFSPNTGGVSRGPNPYYGTPQPAPTKTPTFQPASSTLTLPPTDPRIDSLMASLSQQQSTPTTTAAPTGPDFTGINAQASQLRDLTAALMAGRGPQIGSVAGDPAAKAFRAAKLREADRNRESEAARLGASGVSGSGDFDSRVAQINESAGTDIANFEGTLAGQRKQEALAAATTGAGLSLQDLGRQQTQVQSDFDAQQRAGEIANARSDQQAALDRQQKQDLLAVLLGQQHFGTDTAFRSADNTRADAAEARAQAEFAQTDAGKASPANVPPPGAYWDWRRGWVSNKGQVG